MSFSKIKNYAISFINGYYFPVFVAILTLLSAFCGLEILTITLIVAVTCVGLVLCDDMRFMISPVLFITFTISNKSLGNGTFQKTGFIIWIAIAILILVGFIIAHFIIYKKTFKSVIKSKLFIGFMALFIVYLLGGLFNYKDYYINGHNVGGYTLGELIFVLTMILMFSIAIFLLGAGVKPSKDLQKHFVWILYLASLIVTIQVFYLIIFGDVFKNGSIIKERIVLGWSTWNGIGAMLTVLLPIHFYLATIHKRGYIFFATGLISYLSIILTLSRGSFLFSTIIIGLCIIYGCLKGNNKKMFRILTIIAFVCGVLGIIILWGKISNILVDYLNRGFSDNGRFQLYTWAMESFSRHPLFGTGFSHVYNFDPVTPDILAIGTPVLTHNTIIQFLAACGIVGLCGYAFHRYQTIKLFISQRKSSFSIFMALCILGLLLTSLLDVHFFIFYHILYYATILTIVEKVAISNIDEPKNNDVNEN